MPVLRRQDAEFQVPDELPVVALRDLVFFPYMVLPLLVGREASLGALGEAERGPRMLLVVAQRDASVDRPSPEDLHPVGTVVKLVQTSRLPDGTARVTLEGLGVAGATDLRVTPSGLRATVKPHEPPRVPDDASGFEALTDETESLFREYVTRCEQLPEALIPALAEGSGPDRLSCLLAGHLMVSADDRQRLLEATDLELRFRELRSLITQELEILRIEERLDEQIRRQVDRDRARADHGDPGPGVPGLHPGTPPDAEWVELDARVAEARLPRPARDRAERELVRLRRLNPAAPESSVIRTYLDWILGLPWEARSKDNLDVRHAERILEEQHHGLSEVKERIVDHIAVLSLVGELRGPILCLAGPPGVGKTSLGESIAEALSREFVRVSLGGVRDEAEIRGHRRTYVGALPGRVIQGMRRSGTVNPVFLLDEVDKLARDVHGDPGAALLEVLDPEQNRTFQDHYLELDYDLSQVMFVATANTLQEIPEPLRDRMEVIRLPGYLDTEKRAIATGFLWPKQARRHGIDPGRVRLGEPFLDRVVDVYTREAGVRELDQRLSRVARKLARKVADGSLELDGAAADTVLELDQEQVRRLLGPPVYVRRPLDEEADRAGIANGLAWTAAGGEVLDVEVVALPGSGQIQLTGTLGDVMKESAFAAMTYARARSSRLGLDDRFYQTLDTHIHLPEGSTPKDGPSAGITIATALISALTGIPTCGDLALTGEITLRGRVIGVGGIKEKCVAALRAGIRTVVLPVDNLPDLELLPDEVRDGIRFVPVSRMDEVVDAALTRSPPSGLDTTSAHPSGIQLSQ